MGLRGFIFFDEPSSFCFRIAAEHEVFDYSFKRFVGFHRVEFTTPNSAVRRRHVEMAAILAVVVGGMWATMNAKDFSFVIMILAVATPIVMGVMLILRR
jgi:hypothetical protein